MTRRKRLLLNSSISIVRQVVLIVYGFVIPHLFITHYGSSTNGLINSITQFLGFISLAELGVGAVVQSSFYKPLADKNNDAISRVFVSSERFFRKIGYVLVVYTVILCLVFPKLSSNTFDSLFTIELILIISIGSFAQYFFGMTYRLLLNSDQKSYIQFGLNCLVVIFSTIVSVILVKVGFDIRVVKATASVIHLCQPFVLREYVKKHYKINRKVELREEPIKQKWHGLSQHIASVILTNTDVVVLTLFSSLENISVYSVYHLVVGGVQTFITAATNGFQSLFGEIYARNEKDTLNQTFDIFECFISIIVTVLFSATGILLIPFVRVYTKGVVDANYIVPTFAVLITAAQAFYSLRLPYNLLVLAAGHYKETEKSAILEALINIVISVIFVFKMGLIGVALGTLSAMIYRTLYLALYVGKYIVVRKISLFLKHIFVDCLIVTTIVIIYILCIKPFFYIAIDSYFRWALLATVVLVEGLMVSLGIHYLVFKQSMIRMSRVILHKKSGVNL